MKADNDKKFIFLYLVFSQIFEKEVFYLFLLEQLGLNLIETKIFFNIKKDATPFSYSILGSRLSYINPYEHCVWMYNSKFLRKCCILKLLTVNLISYNKYITNCVCITLLLKIRRACLIFIYCYHMTPNSNICWKNNIYKYIYEGFCLKYTYKLVFFNYS